MRKNKSLITCSELWSRKEKKKVFKHIRSAIWYFTHTINFTLFAMIFFSHLEIRIIISINVIWSVRCNSFQKLCPDSSGIFKNSYFISKVSSVPFSSDHCSEHRTYTAEFGSSKDPGVDHMFPLLLKSPIWHTDVRISKPSFVSFCFKLSEWRGRERLFIYFYSGFSFVSFT